MIGPITIDVKVHVGNDNGVTGAATVGLPVGEVPTIVDLHEAIGKALAALPGDFRLLEPGEFLNRVLIKEKTGRIGNFAVPPTMIYDAEALSAASRSAFESAAEGEQDFSEDDELDDDDDDI